MFQPESLIVAVKLSNLFESSSKRKRVQSIKIHEEFKIEGNGQDNDFNLGLLIVQEDIQFSLHVHSACLPPSDRIDLNGKMGIALGWGFNENYQISATLQQIQVPTFPLIECFFRSNRKFFSGHATKRNFCAGFPINRGICAGDAGNGLFIKIADRYFVYGVTSISNCKCVRETGICELFDEGIFMNVAAYLQWIHNNMF